MHTYTHICVQEMAKMEVFKKIDVSPAAELRYAYIYIYIYIHIKKYTYAYTYIHVHTYIHTYIHTRTGNGQNGGVQKHRCVARS